MFDMRWPWIIIEDGAGHALHYFMAILNSKLAAYHLQGVCPPKLSGYIEFSYLYNADAGQGY